MTGIFYIQLTKKGNAIKNPDGQRGYISVQNKKLHCFSTKNQLVLEIDVLDFFISADGVLFKGIEDENGRKQYQEMWFVPKELDK